MVRNAGKFGKPKRGGKKVFTQDLKPLDAGGEKSGMWDEDPKDSDEESESESEESGESSEEEEDGGLSTKLATTSIGGSSSNPQLSTAEARAQRKAAKKKATGKSTGPKNGEGSDEEESDDEDLINPNRETKKAVKVSEISKVAPVPMNRKEREAAEKKAAQERYWKLHHAGKTDEAKVDLARLAKIRQEREQAAAFRKAEAEAKAKEAAERATLSGRKKK